MFNRKFIISISIFLFLLIITSFIKNETRAIEKNISNLNVKVLSLKKNINEAQLDFYYLTSPAEIEKKLNSIGFHNYQPIVYSKIFFNVSDFEDIRKKMTNFRNSNEKKIKKK